MKVRVGLVALAAPALYAAGCGGSGGSGSTSAGSAQAASSGGSKSCAASIGIEAPLTGQAAARGQEQLAFAKLAIQADNRANGTHIALVQGDTQLMPAQAITVTRQFLSNDKIVGVVGPAGSEEVEAVGPLFGRVGVTFVSGSATNPTLTSSGRNPTFFRVVSRDDLQGPEDANFIVKRLHPKALMIVDDQEAYSTALVSAMVPIFQKAGIKVDHESVSEKVADFSSLVAKVTPDTTVVVLPWQVAANGEQFGKNLAEEHKHATIVGTDGMQSPKFMIPGSTVSSFGPDINSIPADASIVAAAKTAFPKFGTFGPTAVLIVLDGFLRSFTQSGYIFCGVILITLFVRLRPGWRVAFADLGG